MSTVPADTTIHATQNSHTYKYGGLLSYILGYCMVNGARPKLCPGSLPSGAAHSGAATCQNSLLVGRSDSPCMGG
eukprot:6179569-Pleurochrysis_carterae.AAC.3